MHRFVSLLTLLLAWGPNASALEVSCPKLVSGGLSVSAKESGWNAVRNESPARLRSGELVTIRPADGTGFKNLGSLQPDNEDSAKGEEQWHWSVEALNLFAVCEYAGSQVSLVKYLGNATHRRCSVGKRPASSASMLCW